MGFPKTDICNTQFETCLGFQEVRPQRPNTTECCKCTPFLPQQERRLLAHKPQGHVCPSRLVKIRLSRCVRTPAASPSSAKSLVWKRSALGTGLNQQRMPTPSSGRLRGRSFGQLFGEPKAKRLPEGLISEPNVIPRSRGFAMGLAPGLTTGLRALGLDAGRRPPKFVTRSAVFNAANSNSFRDSWSFSSALFISSSHRSISAFSLGAIDCIDTVLLGLGTCFRGSFARFLRAS
mmetsp:Transcript_62312/g.102770  ORF Transcript_62312/g.102770 Transcript_62312/m.102770 type:complete len:234 (+) Transcript_62312:138-839(+)